MLLLIQRVKAAQVSIGGEALAAIGPGLLVFAGFGEEDGETLPATSLWRTVLSKTLDLRIFPDNDGRMNVSLKEANGELLAVSQFTLFADCRKGRRPSFTGAAAPARAQRLYDRLVQDWSALLPGKVRSGVFGADMDVSLTNWGPVTMILDSNTFGGQRAGMEQQ